MSHSESLTKMREHPLHDRLYALTGDQRLAVLDFAFGYGVTGKKSFVKAVTAGVTWMENQMPPRRSAQDEAATFNAEGKR